MSSAYAKKAALAMDLDEPEHWCVTFVKIFAGNFSPQWVVGVGLVVVFIQRLGFPRMGKGSWAMDVHMTMAFTFVITCAWNLYHTPDQGPFFRHAHKWIGRLAMVCGLVSVVTGVIYLYDGESELPLSPALLMTVIGAMQLTLQALGLWYMFGLRWVRMHAMAMTMLFYMSAVLIGINWLPKIITLTDLQGVAKSNWTFLAIVIGIGVARFAVKWSEARLDMDGMPGGVNEQLAQQRKARQVALAAEAAEDAEKGRLTTRALLAAAAAASGSVGGTAATSGGGGADMGGRGTKNGGGTTAEML